MATVSIDGTDLSSYGVIEDMSGVMTHPPLNNEPLAIPGRAGALFVEAQYAGYSFDVPLVVTGDSREDVDSALDSVLALLDTRTTPVTVTRTRGTTSESAECVVLGPITVQYLGRRECRVLLSFYNLEGSWTAGGSGS